MVPGIDAVVRRTDGSLAYVGGLGAGTLAERIVIDPRAAFTLPDGTDPATVAASMNPAMSSWVVLHARVPFTPGKSVLVIGATGHAGSLAVKAARHLGAGRVIAAGRNQKRLEQLLSEGADEIVTLGEDESATSASLALAAGQVDIVLDYVWGAPTELAMGAILRARTDHTQLLDWVQIGSMGARRSRSTAQHFDPTRCGSAAAGWVPSTSHAPGCPSSPPLSPPACSP